MKGMIGIEPARRVIESAVDAVSPGATDWILSQEEALAQRLAPFRALIAITGFLGGLALLMTLSGIYGVLSYLVGPAPQGIRNPHRHWGPKARTWGAWCPAVVEAGGLRGRAGRAVGMGPGACDSSRDPAIDGARLARVCGGIVVVIAAALAAVVGSGAAGGARGPAVTLRCD